MKFSLTKDSIPRFLTTVFLLVATVYLISTTVIGLKVSYTPFPMGDSPGMVMFMDQTAHDTSLYNFLLQEHNEHRILFTKSLLLFDYYFLGGQKLFLIGLLHLLNAGIFYLVYRFFRRDIWDIKLFLILSAFFFSLVQFENFDSAFQLQFFFVNLFGCLSFLFFEGYLTERKRFYIGFTVMWAALAAYNMSNGLFVIFSVVCIGFLFPRRRHLQVLPISLCVIWFFYFFHYDSFPESGSFRLTFGFLVRLVEYVLMFIGNPFHLGHTSKIEVYAFGGIGLLLGLWLLVKTLLNRKEPRVGRVFTATAILFIFISIVAVAYGRLKTGGPEQALTGRYSSTSVLYWAIVIGAFWKAVNVEKKIAEYCFLSVVLLGVGILVCRQSSLFQQMHQLAQQRELIAASVFSYVKDMPQIRKTFAHYQWITFERMRDKNMLPFRNAKYPLPEAKQLISTEGCESYDCLSILAIEEREVAHSDETGYMLIGESMQPLQFHELAIINPEKQVVGYATKLRHQGEFLPGYSWQEDKDYWIGYVGASSQPIQLLSLVEANRGFEKAHIVYHQMNSILEMALFTSVKLEEGIDRSALEVAIKASDSFHPNGYYAGILEEKPFEVFGTWSQLGKKKYTGSLCFELKLDDPDRRPSVLLPFVLGPNRQGIRILVRNYDRQTIYSLPVQDLITHHWYFLDLGNALSSNGLEVEIIDSSGEWGEWCAVGVPFSLIEVTGDSVPVVSGEFECLP